MTPLARSSVVCGPEDRASGVLRAGEIGIGAEMTRKHRFSARNDRELAKGPARLVTALDVDRALNGVDVVAGQQGPLPVVQGAPPSPDQVRSGPRTGVGGNGPPQPWHFWIGGDLTVSPNRAHAPRRRST
jgi:DNA-3-methyladenine glycosylase